MVLPLAPERRLCRAEDGQGCASPVSERESAFGQAGAAALDLIGLAVGPLRDFVGHAHQRKANTGANSEQ